jgi:hypothetical protein
MPSPDPSASFSSPASSSYSRTSPSHPPLSFASSSLSLREALLLSAFGSSSVRTQLNSLGWHRFTRHSSSSDSLSLSPADLKDQKERKKEQEIERRKKVQAALSRFKRWKIKQEEKNMKNEAQTQENNEKQAETQAPEEQKGEKKKESPKKPPRWLVSAAAERRMKEQLLEQFIAETEKRQQAKEELKKKIQILQENQRKTNQTKKKKERKNESEKTNKEQIREETREKVQPLSSPLITELIVRPSETFLTLEEEEEIPVVSERVRDEEIVVEDAFSFSSAPKSLPPVSHQTISLSASHENSLHLSNPSSALVSPSSVPVSLSSLDSLLADLASI